ncbi:unnamed protein product [Calypogeia fissa]
MGGISRLREVVTSKSSRGVTVHMGWRSLKLGNLTVSPKYIFVAAFLLISVCFLVSSINKSSLFMVDEDDFECSPLPSQQPLFQHDPGRSLVESIRRARLIRSDKVGVGSPFQGLSIDALKSWNEQHPCQSRGPNGLLSFYNRSKGHPAESVPSNPLWAEVFEEYVNLHRECMHKVGHIVNYFLQKNSSSGCKFLVADVANRTDFGDKILVLASSLLYAILTQRVILIPESTLVPSYMCEPFVGSSWLLDSSSSALLSNFWGEGWESDREIFRATDWRRRNSCSKVRNGRFQSTPYAAMGIGKDQRQPEQRFYCTREQEVYSEATFMFLSGLMYTIPKLFGMPMFRPTLEVLFPDRIVLTRLLRSAFLPGDPIWKRVKGLHQGYLQPAHRRVGIELMYNRTGGEMNKVINKRVTDCLIKSDILPSFKNSWEARGPHPAAPAAPIFINQVLLSSLHLDLKDHLARIYERNPTSTGEAVGVVQVSQFGEVEEFSVDADMECFKEALLLSFSDNLLVTPMSTLGSVAQGYGALVPWVIDVRKDSWFKRYGTCQRAQSMEVCNHFADKRLACSSGDSSIDGQVISHVVPYIEDCLTIDHAGGIQLITSSRT